MALRKDPTQREGRIGYVLGDFPLASETFVLGEVMRLAERGIPLELFSLGRRRRGNPAMLAELTAANIAVDYVMDGFVSRFFRGGFPFALRHPLRTLSALWSNWRLPVHGKISKPGRVLKAILVAEKARSLGLTHLHAHWLLPCDVAMLAASMIDVSFSYTAHAHDIYEDAVSYDRQRPGSGTRDRIERASFVSTCTRQNLEFFRDHAADVADRVHVVYHGVDLARFDGKRHPAQNQPPVMLGVGRLVAYKGFDVLVDACQQLAEQGASFECVIVGDGSQRAALEAAVRAYGLETRIRFLGTQPQEVVRDWMRRAEIFVLCGKPELGQYGLPNVLFEAMSMGIATVAAPLPTLGELITDGVDGRVLDDDHPLAEVLADLLAHPEERERLGRAGRQRIEAYFDADATIEHLAALLRDAASRTTVVPGHFDTPASMATTS